VKITRYFQSCLLVEDGKTRLLIDPSGQEAGNLGAFGKLDAVLYTHEHGDHFDPDLAEKFAAAGAKMYANASTAKHMKAQPAVVTDGQEFEVAGMKIQAKELPHCLMVDGSTSVQNTGYLLNERLFHPGDGKELAGLNVEILAVPINGPDISLHDAYVFTMQVGAKQVVPIHFDYLGGNPGFLGRALDEKGVKLHDLENGESVDL